MALHHFRPAETVNLTERAASEPPHRALVKTSQFEAIHLTLTAGEEIPEHRVAGFATIHCVQGSVNVILDKESASMTAGDWLYLDRGQRHSVRAIDDAMVLLTIMLGE